MSETLRSGADRLLHGLGLISILQSYGQPTVTGSYYLDLMVWRDLDLYVTIDLMTRTQLYELVHVICSKFQPRWIEAKEEKGFPPGCVLSYFLGFETEIVGDGLWNVDIWFVNEEYIRERQAYLDRILSASSVDRQIIYHIKQELCELPEYGQCYFSVDVYDSVLDGGVRTVGEFHEWHKRRG